MVGRFYGMLYLSAKHSRSLVWWTNSIRETIWEDHWKDRLFHLVHWLRIHQFGKKVLPGLFLGYALYAGGFWKGNVLVADLEELQTMDASEIYSKRLNAKEAIFPKEKGEFIFPVADGKIKFVGGDQDLRTSTSIRQRPIQGESHLWFSWRIRRVSSTTSRLVSGCRWSDEWRLVHFRKLHIPPSRWTQSQTLLAERRIIPYSTEIHWCIQN